MAEGGMSLDKQFINFIKFKDPDADGKLIKLTMVDTWFKQAKLFDRNLTMTDTGICFFKFKSTALNYQKFLKFLEDLAREKKIPFDDIKDKLENCGLPGADKKAEANKPGLPRATTF